MEPTPKSTAPAADADPLHGAERLPPLPPQAQDEAQRAAAALVEAGPRKALFGPFIALLRRPELLTPVQTLGAVLRFEGVLPRRLTEFATLCIARRWRQRFEWSAHVPLALAAGCERATLEALRAGRRPGSMTAEEALVHDFVAELHERQGVADARYAAACAAFGEAGVVELVTLCGYYTLLAMVLNVARTATAPASDPLATLPD